MSADEVRNTFDLGQNNFIVERFIREFIDFRPARYSLELFSINRNKTVDVILRNIIVDYRRLQNLNPSYLSNEALKNVVKSIIDRSSTSLIDENFLQMVIDLGKLTMEPSSAARDPQNVIADLVESYFHLGTPSGCLDFAYLLENDRNLLDKRLRRDRIRIYEPLIDLVSKETSKVFMEAYSFSKLENDLSDNDVFDFILDVLKNDRFSFWNLLCNTLNRTNNIYVSLFIERMILTYVSDIQPEDSAEQEIEDLYHIVDTGNKNPDACYLEKNNIIRIQNYLQICSKEEMAMVAMNLPSLFNRVGTTEPLEIEPFIRKQIECPVENARFSLASSKENYRLKMVYKNDSVAHEATVIIPLDYPRRRARIEFDHKSSNNTMFYHRLNELLSKTSKFVEILTLWKVDIDDHIAGYTECLICYFIMEPVSRTLPDFKCGTCKSNYHKKCIFKWIGESRNSLCPICRTEMHVWD